MGVVDESWNGKDGYETLVVIDAEFGLPEFTDFIKEAYACLSDVPPPPSAPRNVTQIS